MSPRVLRTTRSLPKETWELERFAGLDGQGKPSYASPVDFDADVVEGDPAARRDGNQYLTDTSGSRILVRRTLYIEGDEPNIPDEQDRVGPPGGTKFIVAEKSSYRGLRYARGEEDHFRVRVRDE